MNELTVEAQPMEKPMTAMELRAQVNLIQGIMAEVMQEGQHFGRIPGCGDKPTLLKPGAEKLSMTFRLRPIIDNDKDIRVENFDGGHREYTVYCHVRNSQDQELATGIGSCSTMESKYRYRGGERTSTGKPVPTEYWNLRKEAKNKEAQELIGGKGMGVMKDGDKWVICQLGEKMENPDIADTYNTVLKMAKKRAFVDGILSATAASDIFTQDIEDMTDSPAKPDKPTPASPQRASEVRASVEKPANGEGRISEAQAKRLFAILQDGCMNEQDKKARIGRLHEFIKQNFGIEHTKEIGREGYDHICDVAKSIAETANERE